MSHMSLKNIWLISYSLYMDKGNNNVSRIIADKKRSERYGIKEKSK